MLPAFTDCEELRRWYVDAALPQVGPWGLGDGTLAYAEDAMPGAATTRTDSAAVGNSDTGTNVQEVGIDEPDVAKTDGSLVFRVQGRRLVVTDVTGDEARRVAELRLPGRTYVSRELLLVEDTLLVTSSGLGGVWGGADRVSVWGGGGTARTRLVTVDVSTPAAPVVTSRQRIDGSLVAAREYGDGTVRVVTSKSLPDLPFVHPGPERSDRAATRANREVVRDTVIGDWLPAVHRSGEAAPLVDCADVRHPARDSGAGTISVVTFDVADPTALDTLAVSTSGDLVYSSADRLYVATVHSPGGPPVPLMTEPSGATLSSRTQVHAFALEEGTTSYVASGAVRGTVRDRWSFSEQDGRLRVASALGDGWTPRENAVTVLEEDGDRLRSIGRVAGLGRGEQIQSVRWWGDLAVVVTFRQTDPLYTVDLSDPTDPEVLGALKIRGFSAYLHPVGDGRLLGLGRDATRRGADLGAQAALFDLADLEDVTRTGTTGFARGSDLSAATDPRSFTYLPEDGLALTGVTNWRTGHSRLIALRVGDDGTLTPAGSWQTHRWDGQSLRALPLGDGRVALVDHGVRIVEVT